MRAARRAGSSLVGIATRYLEVLGGPGHERYRVRWDERHESMVFPSANGVHISHPGERPKR